MSYLSARSVSEGSRDQALLPITTIFRRCPKAGDASTAPPNFDASGRGVPSSVVVAAGPKNTKPAAVVAVHAVCLDATSRYRWMSPSRRAEM